MHAFPVRVVIRVGRSAVRHVHTCLLVLRACTYVWRELQMATIYMDVRTHVHNASPLPARPKWPACG